VPAAQDVDVEALASRARRHLSAYKVPTRWVITPSERIPTLPSGKFDRRKLRTLVTDGMERT
jgi:acyl-CoA synthetase (AMP-forming)/AMP-acid ligase II